MLKYYSGLNNEKLVNYAADLTENIHGVVKIKKIFNAIKNRIEFECESTDFQTSEDTLVMGRGNNFSKNMLLYSILKISDVDCDIRIKYVVDNTFIFSHEINVLPWFYVNVNYFGKDIELDCSFDKEFMNAAGIFHKESKLDYDIENYFNFKGKIFKIITNEDIILDDNMLKKIIDNKLLLLDKNLDNHKLTI